MLTKNTAMQDFKKMSQGLKIKTMINEDSSLGDCYRSGV